MGSGTGSVEVYTQKKSDVVEIIMSNLRQLDREIKDADIKLNLDHSLEWLEKARQGYKKLEERKH